MSALYILKQFFLNYFIGCLINKFFGLSMKNAKPYLKPILLNLPDAKSNIKNHPTLARVK